MEIHIITETTLNKITVCAINYVYFSEAEQTFFLGLMLKVILLKKSKVEQFYSRYLFIIPSKFVKTQV